MSMSQESAETIALQALAWLADGQLRSPAEFVWLHFNLAHAASARWLREHLVVTRHAIKGALLPVVSYLGPAFASVLTGSVVIEKVFNVPGLGTFFVDAAFNRDYFLVLGVILVYSLLLIVLNFVVDLLYTVLDPRVSYD